MMCYIVTEDQMDVVLLSELLRPDFDPETHNIRITEAGGWSGADAFARSILADRKGPVALVVDADTNDPARVRERQRFLESSLGQFGPSSEWKVFLAVPQIETLFFEDFKTLEALVGKRVPKEQFIRGQYEPKKVLAELFQGQRREQTLAHRLRQIDLMPIRQSPLVRDLRAFLQKAVQKPAVQATTF